jgi:hypothetical protein
MLLAAVSNIGVLYSLRTVYFCQNSRYCGFYYIYVFDMVHSVGRMNEFIALWIIHSSVLLMGGSGLVRDVGGHYTRPHGIT